LTRNQGAQKHSDETGGEPGTEPTRGESEFHTLTIAPFRRRRKGANRPVRYG
jgi:hypothetical protein